MNRGTQEFHQRVEDWIRHGYCWNQLRMKYGRDSKTLIAELQKGGPYSPPYDDFTNWRYWQASAWIERRPRLESAILDNPETFSECTSPEMVRRIVGLQQKRMTVDLMRWGMPVEGVLEAVAFSPEDGPKVMRWIKELRPAHFRERTARALKKLNKVIEKNPALLDVIEIHVKNGGHR